MNYSKLITYDICNGKGWRVSLFVSGCKRNCKGCFNPQSHDPNAGKPFTQDTKNLIFKELSKDMIDGFSVLGGEPMSVLSDNRKQVIELCKEVKEKFPNKDIWMWSGYTYDELINDENTKDIFKYIDILVDGPYIEELKNPDGTFKGSDNQHIINVKELRENSKIEN